MHIIFIITTITSAASIMTANVACHILAP